MLQPETAPAGAPIKRWTTLIVDDVADLRFVVKLALQRSGHFDVVAEAEDGVEGIELATAHQPDLVLLDLYMPKMDGLEALPRIKEALPATSKIVVFSGMADIFTDAIMEAGAAGYLVKGEPSGLVVARLTEILGNAA